MIATEEFLTPGQAARELEVSAQWVRKLVQAGRLRAVRTGLGHLIDAESVRALATERKTRDAATSRV